MPRDLPHHPFDVVRMFEANLCAYTGAPYCVTTESCTSAIYLACAWYVHTSEFVSEFRFVHIPSNTYIGVPQSIMNAGMLVRFREEEWKGTYQLKPYPIWDCARRLTRGMYIPGQHQCLSFHAAKHLKIGRGGAILTDDAAADAWYRRARWNGKTEGVSDEDDEYQWGISATMTPEQAATGLRLLYHLPDENPDIPNDYPDLSGKGLFR